MTGAEQTQLEAYLGMLAIYYGEQLPDEVLAMFAADLREFSLAAVKQAYETLRRDPRTPTNRLPRPAAVIALLKPAATPEDAARDVASRIARCVSKYGLWNGWSPFDPTAAGMTTVYDGANNARYHTQREAMRSEIGELGLLVVDRKGGWAKVCQAFEAGASFAQADVRELAKTLYTLAQAGTLHQLPALPEPKITNQVGALMQGALKSLPATEHGGHE